MGKKPYCPLEFSMQKNDDYDTHFAKYYKRPS